MLKNKEFSTINQESYTLSAKAQSRLLKALLRNFGWNQAPQLVLLQLKAFFQSQSSLPRVFHSFSGHSWDKKHSCLIRNSGSYGGTSVFLADVWQPLKGSFGQQTFTYNLLILVCLEKPLLSWRCSKAQPSLLMVACAGGLGRVQSTSSALSETHHKSTGPLRLSAEYGSFVALSRFTALVNLSHIFSSLSMLQSCASA